MLQSLFVTYHGYGYPNNSKQCRPKTNKLLTKIWATFLQQLCQKSHGVICLSVVATANVLGSPEQVTASSSVSRYIQIPWHSLGSAYLLLVYQTVFLAADTCIPTLSYWRLYRTTLEHQRPVSLLLGY